ncbi:Peptidyl-prolyl cis-trans isomerase D [Astathelohania contejeani]|uniref:Peptidyl-prolyl cis-trans isomerase n=1 Tax=Astathelohania contejeani TaxID=164912 RepID=A0ABQ7HWR3_9MICR|nr:Peptidyl-prolyl cis-trans isomerase D [Thelohania contejeani]
MRVLVLLISLLKTTKVYMDIKFTYKNKQITKRIHILLYNDKAPRTCKNFESFIKGHNGLSYKNTHFHRIIDGFMIQGGDIVNAGNRRMMGTGRVSIYGETFDDENLKTKHDKEGILSMANSGRNTNGSQFFITVKPTPHLDGRHVVFGEVVDDTFKYVKMISKVETANDKPINDVIIVDCGIINQQEENIKTERIKAL